MSFTRLQSFHNKNFPRRAMSDFIKSIYFDLVACLWSKPDHYSLCDIACNIDDTVQQGPKTSVFYPVA